jgi:hypothetical protein
LKTLSARAVGLSNVALRPLGLELRRVKARGWRPDHPRILYYRQLVDLMADVPGDIVECGVGQGRSLFILGVLTEGARRPRHLWGFDSFEGLPSPGSDDEPGRFPTGKIRAGMWAYSGSEVRALMLRYRILPDRCLSPRDLRERFSFVRGFYPQSFPEYAGGAISLLHLDVDLYQSYRDCLEYFEPLVAHGGIVAFDEYGASTWPGATRAIEEYYGGPPPGIRQGERWSRWFVVKQ